MKTFIVKIMGGALSALFLLFSLFLAGCATTAKVEPPQAAASASPLIPLACPPHLQKLCGAYDTVQRGYINKLSDDEITEMFIRGFTKELQERMKDPYSQYISLKDKANKTAADKNYTGIGVDLVKNKQAPYTITVRRVFKGTPASIAGIKHGDQITHINGISVADKTISESQNLIRGPTNSRVSLSVSRPCEGDPFTVFIKRKEIEDTLSGKVTMITPNYAYVYIPSFDTDWAMAIRIALSIVRLREQGYKPRGLVLDMRNNPGGSILEAKYVLSLFIKQGNMLSEKERNGTETFWNIHNGHDILFGDPIVVLVNNDTISSSEIVAGALQDSKRAIILGTKTRGKGVLQTKYTLRDGSELSLTTAHTFTPNHTPLSAGITPDILVEEGKDESCTGDHQLAVALDVLRKKNVERTTIAQEII